jgi:RNA polymerase sigma factor (sigma-70 family)
MIVIDNEFVSSYQNVVRQRLRKSMLKYGLHHDAMDDLLTDVWIRALNGARTYNGERGTPTTWLWMLADYAVMDYLRDKEHAAVSLEDGYHQESHEKTDEDADAETTDFLRQELTRYIHLLSHSEKQVLYCLVWKRLSGKQTAAMLGYTEQGVSGMKRRAVKKIKTYLRHNKTVPRYQDVDTDIPLDSAVKMLPDTLYHAYRLVKFLGWPVAKAADTMGRTVTEVNDFVRQAQKRIQHTYGYRA